MAGVKQTIYDVETSVDDDDRRKRPRMDYYTLDYLSGKTFTKAPPFQQPSPLISFSYTPEHLQEFTDSARRYFVTPPIGAKLDYGYDRWIRRPEERGRLDSLLKAFSRVKSGLPQINVVAWRGVMTKLLTAPYEDRNTWDLNVMFVDDTLYLEEHLSAQTLEEKNNVEPKHRRQMYYGYSFESYCTSDTPKRKPHNDSRHPPKWGGDVDTNVQWCSVVRTKLGDMRMVLGGEVDCVREKHNGSTTNEYVELKTSLSIKGSNDERRFERKLLKFYFQSFLLGVPEIYVGFRTPKGELTTGQTFRTMEIPRLVRGKPEAWDPAICLEWGDRFLRFLRQIAGESDPTKETVWRVSFLPKNGVKITVLSEPEVFDVANAEDRVGFLPRWYWNDIVGTCTIAGSDNQASASQDES